MSKTLKIIARNPGSTMCRNADMHTEAGLRDLAPLCVKVTENAPLFGFLCSALPPVQRQTPVGDLLTGDCQTVSLSRTQLLDLTL